MKYRDVGSNLYYKEQVGQEALTFLFNLFNFNLDSRVHVANGIFNAIYETLAHRSGDLAELNDKTRRQLLDLITLEVLSKAFMGIEDLGKVLLTSGKPLKDLPNVILDCGQEDSLQGIGRFAEIAPLELKHVFPFLHPREYGLTGLEEAAVQRYNLANLAALKARLAFIARFIDRHREAYNKYKHGIPIMLGMEGNPLPEGVDGAVPILTAKDRVALILTGPLIVRKFLEVLGLVVHLSKALVERRIQIVKLGGKPPLPLCHTRQDGDKEDWTPWNLGTANNDDTATLENVFRKTLSECHSTRLEATFKVNIEHTKIQALVDYYFRDWNLGAF